MLYLLRRLRVLRYAALRSGADDLPLPAPNVSLPPTHRYALPATGNARGPRAGWSGGEGAGQMERFHLIDTCLVFILSCFAVN